MAVLLLVFGSGMKLVVVSNCTRGALDLLLGKISVLKSCQALEQAAWGSGGVPIPRGVQKPCRCGTSGHGGVGLTVGLDDLKGLLQT